jgi:hypothetical protein
MIPVNDLIVQARELRPEFVDRLHPGPTCERFLVRYARELVGKLRPIAVETVAVVHEIAMPLADHAAGYDLPAFQEVLRYGFAYFGEGRRRLTMAHPKDREASQYWPSFYVVGTTLFLCHDEANWTGATKLVIRLVPAEPVAESTNGPDLLLPVEATSTLVAALAAFMAGRSTTMKAQERREMADEARLAEASFLRQVSTRLQPATNIVEEW